jgi:hypothetical protein
MEKQNWFYLAIGGVAVSIISLFMSIITYVTSFDKYTFNIMDFIGFNKEIDTVLAAGYRGPSTITINGWLAGILGFLAVAAVVCAVIGLITLREQRPNTAQFTLTIIGLIGVMIPSIVAMVVVFGYGKDYAGEISLGLAPIITPIAMFFSIMAVIRRKNKVAEEIQNELRAKGLIHEAGDLD